MKIILDKYEIETEKAIKKGKYISVKNQAASLRELEEAAKNYFKFKKSKSITLRVKNQSLLKFKAKAKNVGIPYQRIINTFIDQYSEGKLRLEI